MFKVTTKDLSRVPSAYRYAYYLLTAMRLVTYKSWQKEGEPNPFVARRAPKQTMTHLEAQTILKSIDPFVVSRMVLPEPRPFTLVREANGLMRPRHMSERRYQVAA